MSEQDAKLAEIVDEQTRKREGAPEGHPELDKLVRTIWRLRQPDGCPWDRAQTHQSIRQNMLEEAYEAADAIDEGSVEHLREELGDVLMQVILHAQFAADEGAFDFDDVCREINEKLVRRHPHVFGDEAAQGAGEALGIWAEVKRVERERAGAEDAPQGLLDSVPHAMPALMQALKLSKRAAKAGFEWPSVDDVWDQVDSERGEFAAEDRGTAEAEMEFGDLLFALVNVARWERIDPELALTRSNDKFRRRWADMERMAREQGVELEDLSTERLNELWDLAKHPRI